MVKMTDAEILLNDVTDFRDGLVPLFFISGQFRTRCRFSHDAVFDAVHMQKIPVVFPKISFIGKHLFYRIFGMTTGGDTQREIGAVMVGGRGHFRGKDKTVTGIDGGMLFETKMRDVVSHGPIGIEIAGEFKKISVLVQLALRRFSFVLFFFQFFFGEGTAGRLHQTRIDGDAFVDG